MPPAFKPTESIVDQVRYRAAVDALPAASREVFILHRAEGLDIASIAERTGVSSSQVEQYLADAILAVWIVLDDCEG